MMFLLKDEKEVIEISDESLFDEVEKMIMMDMVMMMMQWWW